MDVDSDNWAQYAAQKLPPMRWVYQRKRDACCAWRKFARRFDAGLFVSSTEAELFRQLSPVTAHKIGFYNNGVNCEYFQPDANRDTAPTNPFAGGSRPLVFTGAMDYWPNVDAVIWFAESVFFPV